MKVISKLAWILNFFCLARTTNQHKENSDVSLTVGTYNIWNVMFHWDVRKQYIAEMIKKNDIDVIGFQEVRAHKDRSHSQLFELQDLLPSHKWIIYHPANLIKPDTDQGPPGWELEGIGLLSKYRILSYHIVNLTRGRGVDENPRAFLSAQLSVEGVEVSVVVVHFSYDRKDQCNNAWDVLKYLHTSGVDETIMMGDFNAYNDYYWPVDALMHGDFGSDAPEDCKRRKKPWFHGQSDYTFSDAWTVLKGQVPGFTFSNMPDPGLHSRPDRILVSKTGLTVKDVHIIGSGDYYARHYRSKLLWSRVAHVIGVAQSLIDGAVHDNFCDWDCGPHGVCICGICVPNGHTDDCESSYCDACSPMKLRLFQFLFVCFSTLASLCAISVILIVMRLARIRIRSPFYEKLKRSILARAYFTISMFVAMIVIYYTAKTSFNKTLQLIYAQIDEELFPSDHLMVVTKVLVT